ncbi:MAG: hypothetical protein KDA92_05495 [Planctomycetales bacterium]|nr:hypothetical protein [Planctomycetales bacterium]MCA9168489.1 hypothetical protein [Planctomycetales bacterium]
MFRVGFGIALIGIVLAACLRWIGQQVRLRRELLTLVERRSAFSRRREWLEAKFLQIANSRGTPRGLEWIDCDFEDNVRFAKDRRTGELTALVGVAIQFRAIEGGGMEHVEAVANQKAATAVFRFRESDWMTEGRALFNLNPLEALEYYQTELEPVE